VAGTPIYNAPEMLLGEYNKPSDIWSFGAIYYELLSGTNQLLFKGNSAQEILADILNTKFLKNVDHVT
jgi:serine/threonine protein kinase